MHKKLNTWHTVDLRVIAIINERTQGAWASFHNACCKLLRNVLPVSTVRFLATYVGVPAALLLLRELQLVADTAEGVAVPDGLEIVWAALNGVCHV